MIRIFSSLYISIFTVLIFSCQPDEFPPIGEKQAVIPALAGTWRLTSVIQKDEDATRKGFPDYAQVQDITSDFPFNEFTLTLVTNGNEPASFSIDAGNSPNIIGNVTSGNWSVDHIDFPSKIVFTGDAQAAIELGSVAGLNKGNLEFRLIRTQPKAGKEEAVVTYEYSFTKE